MSQAFVFATASPTPLHIEIPFPLTLTRGGLSGFPSPAEDYAGRTLDLNERFIKRQSSTFFLQVTGDSMTEYGIPDGSMILVDRSIDPRPGHVVVALVEGEVVVKRYEVRGRWPMLCSGGNRYPPIPLQDIECQIWGVVRSVHHELCV